MEARAAHRLVVLAIAVLASASVALAEDSAQDLRNQALWDITSLRDASSGSLRNHLNEAIRALNRTADSFIDGNHVSTADVFDRFHQAAESIRQGAREAVRRSQISTADRLRADADRLARSARLLATTLLGEVRADTRVIDRKSAQKRARSLEKAEREIGRGDADLARSDRSFRPYVYPAFDEAIEKFKQAFKEAEKGRRFRLALVEATDGPDSFNSQRTANVLTARYEVRVHGDGQTIRTEWTILSPTGQVLRRITADTQVLRRRGDDPRVGEVIATLTFDGRDDAGAVLADGTYNYRVTGSILPEDEDHDDDEEDDEDDEEDLCERGNCLDGYLTGSVTIDRGAPEWQNVVPAAGSSTDDLRQGFSADLFDGGGGVDVSTMRLRLDGADVTALAAISASRVSFTPSSALACGIHRYEADVSDLAGNAADPLRIDFEVVCEVVVIVPPDTGGEVRVPDDHPHLPGLAVVIPAGATETPATITISPEFAPPPPPEGGQIVGTVARIESSEGGFLAPVSIVFPYNEAALGGESEENLVLAFYDETAGVWVIPESLIIDPSQNTATIQTTTLSLWGLIVFRDAFNVSPTRSTVRVVPSLMRVDSPAPQAAVEVIPRKYSGALTGSGRQVSISIVSGQGTLGSVQDLGNGTYRADLTAPTTPGTARFRAFVGNVRLLQEPTATYLAGAAASFRFIGFPSSVEAGEQATFFLEVRDRFGNFATGYGGVVQFICDDPLASINGQPASTFTVDFPDDGSFQGQVKLLLVLRTAGPVSFTARDSADPTLQAAAAITVMPGPIASFAVVEGNGQSGEPGQRLPNPLRARAQDAFGNDVAGVNVSVAVVSGDGQLQPDLGSPPEPGPLTLITDSGGLVSAFWTLGAIEGPQSVEMRPAGTTLVASFTATAVVDRVDPTVTFDVPTNFALLQSGTFLLRARYADDLSGIDPQTAQVLVNNVDLTSFAQVGEGTIQLDLQGDFALIDGVHTAIIFVRDRAGNEALDSVQFLVDSTPPEVRIEPPDGTVITTFPVTFTVRVADAGSFLVDSPARIFFNSVDVTSRFTAEVQYRIGLWDVYYAQVLNYTYTPSVDEFVGLVRASGNGTLVLRVDAVDRTGNLTRVDGSYPVNLSGGQQVPRIIVLQDAFPQPIPAPPPGPTNRCDPVRNRFIVRAVDLTNGAVPVAGLALDFQSPDGWGQFHDLHPGSTITNADGLGGSDLIAGPTPGMHPITVSASDEPSVAPLELTAAATEPTLDPIADVEVEPGSGSTSGIDVLARNGGSDSYGLIDETITIVMVDPQGQESPVDESKFWVMPAEKLTSNGGNAHFALVATAATQPGSYTLRAKLVEWEASTDFRVRVLDPRQLLPYVPTLPPVDSGTRNVYLAATSGNGQLGVHDAPLGQAIVVQLMKDGAATGPISEYYTINDSTYELRIRKVRFFFSPGFDGDTLTPAAGTEVELDGSGRASATVTYGAASQERQITATFIVEYGVAPDIVTWDVPGGVTFVQGAPEVRIGYLESATAALTRDLVPTVDPVGLDPQDLPSGEGFFVEALVPGGQALSQVTLRALDACRGAVPEDVFQPPVERIVPLTLFAQSQRYDVYRSAELFGLQAAVTYPEAKPEGNTGGTGPDILGPDIPRDIPDLPDRIIRTGNQLRATAMFGAVRVDAVLDSAASIIAPNPPTRGPDVVNGELNVISGERTPLTLEPADARKTSIALSTVVSFKTDFDPRGGVFDDFEGQSGNPFTSEEFSRMPHQVRFGHTAPEVGEEEGVREFTIFEQLMKGTAAKPDKGHVRLAVHVSPPLVTVPLLIRAYSAPADRERKRQEIQRDLARANMVWKQAGIKFDADLSFHADPLFREFGDATESRFRAALDVADRKFNVWFVDGVSDRSGDLFGRVTSERGPQGQFPLADPLNIPLRRIAAVRYQADQPTVLAHELGHILGSTDLYDSTGGPIGGNNVLIEYLMFTENRKKARLDAADTRTSRSSARDERQ